MTDKIRPKAFAGVRAEVATSLSFDDLLARLRRLMGHVSPAEIVRLAQTPVSEAEFVRTVQERFVGESGFTLFAEVDHGGRLHTLGVHRRTVRWILGNPLIAVTMIRQDITAGLFAPVEILITEAEDGRSTTVTYLRPASVMVIEENPPLRAAAVLLDAKLDKLVTDATAL